MGTINYKDPTLLATLSTNGVMSSVDKIQLAGLYSLIDGYATKSALHEVKVALDGYATDVDLNAEVSRATAVDALIIQTLDGYTHINMTNLVYVDIGTTSTKYDGNIESPYLAPQAAANAKVKNDSGMVMCIAPGDYLSADSGNPIVLNGCGQTTFVNMAVDMTAGTSGNWAYQNRVDLRTVQNNAMTTFKGCRILNVFVDSLQLRNSVIWGTVDVQTGLWAHSSQILKQGLAPQITSFGGPVIFEECCFQTDGYVLYKMDNADPIEMYRCKLTAAISIHFQGGAGVLKIDNFTYQQWLAFGCTLVNGTISVVDPASGGGGPFPSLDGYATTTALQAEINRAEAAEHQITTALDGYGSAGTLTSVAIDVSLTATANTLIDTRPASPSGINRWKLVSIDVRLKTAITGGGSPSAAISVGSTSGGQQIVLSQTVLPAVAVGTIIGGFSLSTLGSDMSQANGFEAMYPASQAIYANVTATNSPATGAVTIYLVWQALP
jgi:hypothetical protein